MKREDCFELLNKYLKNAFRELENWKPDDLPNKKSIRIILERFSTFPDEPKMEKVLQKLMAYQADILEVACCLAVGDSKRNRLDKKKKQRKKAKKAGDIAWERAVQNEKKTGKANKLIDAVAHKGKWEARHLGEVIARASGVSLKYDKEGKISNQGRYPDSPTNLTHALLLKHFNQYHLKDSGTNEVIAHLLHAFNFTNSPSVENLLSQRYRIKDKFPFPPNPPIKK